MVQSTEPLYGFGRIAGHDPMRYHRRRFFCRRLSDYADQHAIKRGDSDICVCQVLAALVMINGPADEKTENALQSGKVYTGALILTMLANGGGSSMSKIFEQVGTRDQDELYFFYLFFTAAVLTAVLLLLEWKRTGKALKWSEMAAGIAVGIPNYYASFLLLLALVALPAIIVYPINSTGSILIVMAVDALVFHQKYTKRQWLGIVLVLAAMVLLNV